MPQEITSTLSAISHLPRLRALTYDLSPISQPVRKNKRGFYEGDWHNVVVLMTAVQPYKTRIIGKPLLRLTCTRRIIFRQVITSELPVNLYCCQNFLGRIYSLRGDCPRKIFGRKLFASLTIEIFSRSLTASNLLVRFVVDLLSIPYRLTQT